MLRKATVGKGKIDWTDEHEAEYQNAMIVMKTIKTMMQSSPPLPIPRWFEVSALTLTA